FENLTATVENEVIVCSDERKCNSCAGKALRVKSGELVPGEADLPMRSLGLTTLPKHRAIRPQPSDYAVTRDVCNDLQILIVRRCRLRRRRQRPVSKLISFHKFKNLVGT